MKIEELRDDVIKAARAWAELNLKQRILFHPIERALILAVDAYESEIRSAAHVQVITVSCELIPETDPKSSPESTPAPESSGSSSLNEAGPNPFDFSTVKLSL